MFEDTKNYLTRILHAGRARARAEADYNSSKPIPNDHPSGVVELVCELYSRAGITYPPEFRSAYFSHAITLKNCVVLEEELIKSGTRKLIESISAHEMAHLVFNNSGPNAKKWEYQADRFAHFLMPDLKDFVDYLTTSNKKLKEGLQYAQDRYETAKRKRDGYIASGQLDRANEDFTCSPTAMEYDEQQLGEHQKNINRAHTLYGPIEERIANLIRPLSPEEITYFQKAIVTYNARIEKERPSLNKVLFELAQRANNPEDAMSCFTAMDKKGRKL